MAARRGNRTRLLLVGLVFLLGSGQLPSRASGSPDYDYSTSLEGRGDDPLEDQPDKVCEICHCFNESSSALLLDCHSSNLDGVPTWLEEMESLNYTLFLDLSYNAIERVSSFPDLDAWGMDLSHNNIQQIEDGAFSGVASALMQLDLSHNQLTSTGLSQNSFSARKEEGSSGSFKLLELSLAHNQLHTLRSDLFLQLTCLTDLDLSNNPLAAMTQETTEAIASLTTLQTLTLRNAGLQVLPAGLLVGLSQLTSLYLPGNQFSQVDPQINLVTSLEALNLDENYLQVLDDTSFAGLVQLRNLSIRSNHGLTSIEKGTFGKLTQLQQLRISDNSELSWISPDAWPADSLEPFHLEELCLSNNKLTYLPSMLLPDFTHWQAIRIIDIQGNPWMCDCHNEWMINTLVPLIQRNTPELTQEITCGGPGGSSLLHEQLLVVHELTPSADLPCTNQQFNLWDRGLSIPAIPDSSEGSSHSSGLSTVVTLLCFATVAATFSLVGALHLQKKRARRGQGVMRPGGYIIAGTMGGVTEPAAEMTGPKEGVANIAYKDDVEDGGITSNWNQRELASQTGLEAGSRNSDIRHPFGRPL